MLSRRSFLISSSALLVAGCSNSARLPARQPTTAIAPVQPNGITPDFVQMYRAMPEEQFPVPAVDLTKIDPIYYRRLVDYYTPERPGTIVVDTPNRFLYLTMENGQAMRYGVGIGREGFAWGGRARIDHKQEWPTWHPPAEMVQRQPELVKYKNGMPPGPTNPLGARALYIFEGKRDTLYRLHGTSEYWSIGKAVSSGCVRLLQQDVIDLYNRVPDGTPIVVMQT